MAKPSGLPEWDTTEVNSVVPDQDHKDEGWLDPGGVPEKPPFETLNHWMNSAYKWIKSINDLGILNYDALTDYAIGALSVGADAILYKSYIANGPSSSVVNPVGDGTGTWKAFDTPTVDLLRLGHNRSQFAYNTTSVLAIAGGAYSHFGTKEQILKSNSNIGYTLTGVGTSEWQYIYIDDSAVVSAGNNILISAKYTNSTTAPTFSITKGGWYNGDDLCVFAVWIDGSGNITPFYHDGGDSVHWDEIINSTTENPSDTWTNYDLSSGMPAFATRALCTVTHTWADSITAILRWRTDGSSGNGHGISICPVASIPQLVVSRVPMYTSSAQLIEIKLSSASTNGALVDIDSWFFPGGM